MEYLLILNCCIVLFPSLRCSSLKASSRTIQPIYPGTKWCGKGNISGHENDLGWFEETDKCCKSHDKCPFSIPSHKSNFSLYNDSEFTISRCLCDEKFRNCLLDIGMEFTPLLIKELFFDVLTRTCFVIRKGKKPGTLKAVAISKPPFEELIEANGWTSPYDALTDLAEDVVDSANALARSLDKMGEAVAEGVEEAVDMLG